MSQKKTPILRFKGYSDEWELCKLGEVAEFNPKSELPSEFEYIDLESVVGTDLISTRREEKGSAPSRAQRVAQNGDIFYQTVRPYQKNNYLFDMPEMTETYVFSTGYAQMRPQIDSYFLLSQVQEEQFVARVLENSTGTSYPAINSKDLAKIKITVPIDKQEQIKIGKLFKNIDNLITLHQRKLELLKNLKKGYLQQMFPQKDEKTPRLRFANFEGDWVQRKLGDIFFERLERSSEGELISVTISAGVIKADELDRKDNSSTDKSNYKIVKIGDIAYNSMRMWQGASGYSSYEGILSPAYTVIIPKENNNSKFFAYDFKRYDMIQKFKKNSQGLTSDTWNLKFPILKSINILVPSMKEQDQIPTFFEKLDTLITLHQNKLNLLTQLKQSYLQKMFV